MRESLQTRTFDRTPNWITLVCVCVCAHIPSWSCLWCVQCCATTPSFGFFDRLNGPYRICTVQDGASTVCLKVRSEPYKDGATVRYDSDRNLAVWPQFRPIPFLFVMQQISINRTQIIGQESSTASDFEFPCKPLLGPSPELMQPQPGLGVIHRSIVWRQHMGGAHRGAKMGGFWAERPFCGHFCTGSASLAPYRTPYCILLSRW
jgi:hypothetical protein